MTRLEEIQSRLSAVTRGPWRRGVDADNEHLIVSGRDHDGAFIYVDTSMAPPVDEKANAAFIERAPEDVRYLLGLIKRLVAVIQEEQQHDQDACGTYRGERDELEHVCNCGLTDLLREAGA